MKKAVILGANGYIARNLIYTLQNEYPEFELFLYGYEKTNKDGNGYQYLRIQFTKKMLVF